MSTYTKEELGVMVQKMRSASNSFYAMATQTGCHTFIEFTGLMNEYIKICERAASEGVDFTETSAHSGATLPMKDYEVAYLAEKLDCIYGPTLRANEDFRNAMLGG